MNYNDPQKAFEGAIEKGILSDDIRSSSYAGDYMYMGTNDDSKDLFKNIYDRKYI